MRTQVIQHRVDSIRVAQQLRSVVLLGGSVKTNTLDDAVGRSLMELPVADGASVLDHWEQQIVQLSESLQRDTVSLRLLVNDQVTPPRPRKVVVDDPIVAVTIESDPVEFRGTGGVLRDIAEAYEDNDYLLVAAAWQIMLEPLPQLVGELASLGGAVNLVAHEDGEPSGLALVRCDALRMIQPIGFVDFKEQALPAIAGQFEVNVLKRERATGLSIRSREDYIRAVRAKHRASTDDPFDEQWRSSFGIVEPSATVDDTARIHDSVMLGGAQVEAGAVVVRSIVCEGATVARNTTVVDELIQCPSSFGRGRRGTSG